MICYVAVWFPLNSLQSQIAFLKLLLCISNNLSLGEKSLKFFPASNVFPLHANLRSTRAMYFVYLIALNQILDAKNHWIFKPVLVGLIFFARCRFISILLSFYNQRKKSIARNRSYCFKTWIGFSFETRFDWRSFSVLRNFTLLRRNGRKRYYIIFWWGDELFTGLNKLLTISFAALWSLIGFILHIEYWDLAHWTEATLLWLHHFYRRLC